jgi:hypothetical protein
VLFESVVRQDPSPLELEGAAHDHVTRCVDQGEGLVSSDLIDSVVRSICTDGAVHADIYKVGLSSEPGLSSSQHQTTKHGSEEDDFQYSFNLSKWTRRKNII